jgi:hypothetical protein
MLKARDLGWKPLIGEYLLVLIYNPLAQICLCARRLVLFWWRRKTWLSFSGYLFVRHTKREI